MLPAFPGGRSRLALKVGVIFGYPSFTLKSVISKCFDVCTSDGNREMQKGRGPAFGSEDVSGRYENNDLGYKNEEQSRNDVNRKTARNVRRRNRRRLV